MDNNTTLSAARALIAQEEAQAQQYIWEAVIATHDALTAAGFAGLPSVHVERAKAALMRAGAIDAGELPDTELHAIAVTTGTRVWSEIVGTIYKNEQITDGEGHFYICLQQHTRQADWAPGAPGLAALFRPIRDEPEDGAILDFVWGEFVPYGAQRRDPTNNKIYTPISTSGVTLYEPHYPNLVPSQYVEVTGSGSGESGGGEETGGDTPTTTYPRWADLEDNHLFNVGDHFTDYGKTYEVLRQFYKVITYRPPALNNDFYREV